MKKEKNRLSVFNTDWCPWKYLSNWPRNVRLFFRQFKWAYQRVTRGFCDFDTWDLDTYFSMFLADSIKHLADNTHSYPGTEEFPTYESWHDYLYKISDLLNYSLGELPNEYEEAWLKKWENKGLDFINGPETPEEKEITKKFLDKENSNELLKREAQNEALKMICHVYNQLWD